MIRWVLGNLQHPPGWMKGSMNEMIEIICTTVGVIMLCLLGYKLGFESGELNQLKRQNEKNDAEIVVIVIGGGDEE